MKRKEPLGATPLSEEDRLGLIPKDVATREELNAAEFSNINKAYLNYFSFKHVQTRLLTWDGLQKLHRDMFGDVWRWAGEIRNKEVSVGIPVHQIRAELRKFEGDLKAWEEFKHEPIEISAKIHHRLVWIHPFRNGNGRWARLVANLYLHWKTCPLVKWPENEFLISSSFRKEYVNALQSADRGNFNKIIDLHERLLER